MRRLSESSHQGVTYNGIDMECVHGCMLMCHSTSVNLVGLKGKMYMKNTVEGFLE